MPTSTPDPNQAQAGPLLVANGRGSTNLVAAYYLGTARNGQGQQLTAPDPSSGLGDALVPAAGDIDGDGLSDLVLGQKAAGRRTKTDAIGVYHVTKGPPAEPIATIPAFDHSGRSASGNLFVGNVIASEPGDEIVVAEDGSGRRASHIRIFGGLAGGTLRPMRTLRVLNSHAAVHEPLRFGLGDVSPDGAHPGLEIVVGDRRGYVHVFSPAPERSARLQRTQVFPDMPRASVSALAVGDLLPRIPGDEVAVAHTEADHEGLIRIVNGGTGTILFEFTPFASPSASAGIELWIGDVVASLAGSELIIGQGGAGGQLRVFSLARGVPRPLFDLPDSPARQTTLARHLAIGDLVANLPGNEVAVAQPGARVVEVFHLDEHGANRCATVDTSDLTETIGAIAVGRWR